MMTKIQEYRSQLEEEKNNIERELLKSNCQTHIEFNVSYTLGFIAEETETVLAFTFGAIAGGFFSAIGKDIWLKIKESCNRIINSQKKLKDYYCTTEIRATFQFNALQIQCILKLDDNKMKNNLSNPIDIFWEESSQQIEQIITEYQPREITQNITMIKELKLSVQEKRWSWVTCKY
jgi:hypothetical protein